MSEILEQDLVYPEDLENLVSGEEIYLSHVAQRLIEKRRILKAKFIINFSYSSCIAHKIALLKDLGYENVRVKGDEISLEEAGRRHPANLSRMYSNVLNGLQGILKNPSKDSKLAERLDYFQ